MTEQEQRCDACGGPTRSREVYVTLWLGSELNVIEGVPAHVCDDCGLQFYDPDIEDRIRALSIAGFPDYLAIKRISVPVFSVQEPARVNRPATAPETDRVVP